MVMAKHNNRRMLQGNSSPAETAMVRQELFDEIRRTAAVESVSISELARRFGLDRKTIRRCLRDPAYRRYRREEPAPGVLAVHSERPRSIIRRGFSFGMPRGWWTPPSLKMRPVQTPRG